MTAICPTAVHDRYVVSAFDCAGEFDTAESPDFAECLLNVVGMTLRYPGKVVMVSNSNRCDYDSSGLSEDEEEQISTVRNCSSTRTNR